MKELEEIMKGSLVKNFALLFALMPMVCLYADATANDNGLVARDERGGGGNREGGRENLIEVKAKMTLIEAKAEKTSIEKALIEKALIEMKISGEITIIRMKTIGDIITMGMKAGEAEQTSMWKAEDM